MTTFTSIGLHVATLLLLGASSAVLAQGPPFGPQSGPRPQITPDSSTATLKVTTQLTIRECDGHRCRRQAGPRAEAVRFHSQRRWQAAEGQKL